MTVQKLTMEVSEGSDFRGVGGLVKRIVHPSLTGSVNLGVSIAFVAPGEELPAHKHPNEEAYFIVQGSGVMRVEGHPEEIDVHKYLSIYIPANRDHYLKNTGNEPMMIVCSLAPPPVIK